jgi:hypothetical protein
MGMRSGAVGGLRCSCSLRCGGVMEVVCDMVRWGANAGGLGVSIGMGTGWGSALKFGLGRGLVLVGFSLGEGI